MHFFTKVARLINRTDKFKCSSSLYAVYHRLTIFFDRMDEISKLSSVVFGCHIASTRCCITRVNFYLGQVIIRCPLSLNAQRLN